MSSSPQKVFRLSRDRFNNPLWTGREKSSDEDANQQLARYRKAYAHALGGDAAMKGLLADKVKREGEDVKLTGDESVDAVQALYEMLESKDAYVPTRGREGQGPKEGKKRGVRTA